MKFTKPAIYLVIFLLLALTLAWVSTSFNGVEGWLSFFAIFLVIGGVAWLAWASIKKESPPNWVLYLMIGAALLRLVVGVVWFAALPEWGYENDAHQAGYVMRDPYERDRIAWDLARSDEPLWVAFQGYTTLDQYGGVLFLSSLAYRYLGAEAHQPLLIIVMTAVFSALAVLYCWAFTRRLWGDKAARIAAWLLALYPDVVLMGSSQMREAFLVTLGVGIGYFLYLFWDSRRWQELAAVVGLTVFGALVSLPFAALMGVLIVLLSLVLFYKDRLPEKITWRLAALFVGVAAVAGVVFQLFGRWWVKASDLQIYIAEASSGWVQLMFDLLPESVHIPFLVSYGVFRPLLPAALIASSESFLLRLLAVWRAVGWTVVLPLLAYATYWTLRNKNWMKPAGVLVFVNWAVIFISSYRGGGDLWDNPRYRIGFAGFQVALAAWALVQQREQKDPWLRRILVMTGLMVVWVVLWYLPRYYTLPWKVGRPLDAVGLGLISGVLFVVWDLVRKTGNYHKGTKDTKFFY